MCTVRYKKVLFSDDPSEAFTEFMESIGEKVQLKGFDGFRAGLEHEK